MILYLRVAWRNVWRQRRRTFLIAIGMGVTMALLVFYDGLIGGFEQAIYGNAIQLLGGNIQVHAPGYNEKLGRKPLLPLEDPDAVVRAAEAHADVVAASKRIVTGGLVTNREGAFAITIVANVSPSAALDFTVTVSNNGPAAATGVKAVVSRGYSDDEVTSSFREHGFRAFLKKPYRLQDLKSTLSALLE